MNVLPDNYEYLISEFLLKKKSKIAGESQFTTSFRVNLGENNNKDAVKKFLNELSHKSGTEYKTDRGDREFLGKKTVISGSRECIHHVSKRRSNSNKNERHKGPGRQPGDEKVPGKNTDCPANLKFKLAGEALYGSTKMRKTEQRDDVRKYRLGFELEFTHNHSIKSADALRYRNVSSDVKDTFLRLFQQDVSPSAAFSKYKDDLRESCETVGEFASMMADRSIVPDYFWVFHTYANYIVGKYGDLSGLNAYLKAVERINTYNEKHGETLAKIAQTEGGETIVAICDKFNRRVHERLPQAGDIVLVDATSNLDRHDTKLFHIICPSPAGGLPLGTVISSRENTETIQAAFELQ